MNVPTETRLFNFSNFEFSLADFIKVAVVIFAAALAWSGIQSKLDTMNSRLERLETSGAIYVRADVQGVYNQAIDYKLKVIVDQIDRMDKKLDAAKYK